MDNSMGHSDKAAKQNTLFIKDIDRIDCAAYDPSVGVIGKSWYVDVEVTGDLDANGFVYDFSHLKKLVKNTLKSSIDHALLIPIRSSTVEYEGNGDSEEWTLRPTPRQDKQATTWKYEGPKGSVYPVRTYRVTRDVIEQECAKLIRHRLPNSVQRVSVKLRKEKKPGASFFRYTHGISGHEGLCQRLFHGHRSRVEVHVAGEQRPDLERYVAHDLFGSIVHIASTDQAPAGNCEIGMRSNSSDTVALSYRGSLGCYKAEIPLSQIFFVRTFTSIESITKEVALHLREKFNINAPLRVTCFEGIDKGAIADL